MSASTARASAKLTGLSVNCAATMPDGVGTGPIGVALSPDGETAYVANYLSRDVVPVAAAAPLDPDGKPAHLRCIAAGRPGASF